VVRAQQVSRAGKLLEEALEILDEEMRRCRDGEGCELLSQILWMGLKARIMLSMYTASKKRKKPKRAVGA